MQTGIGTKPSSTIYWAISWLAWPVLLALCVLITGYGFTLDRPALFLNVAYTVLGVCLYALEGAPCRMSVHGIRVTAKPSPISATHF